MGISLYSSTPSRSSNTGSASLASSCVWGGGGQEGKWGGLSRSTGRQEEPGEAGGRAYTFHLSVGEDTGEHHHAERHCEDEDEGEGQGGSCGHDGPEQGQAEQLQGREQVHTESPDLGDGDRCHSLAHDSERVGVSDRADSGSSQPGQAKEGTDAAHGHDEQQVQVEAGALLQHALLLGDDEPESGRGAAEAQAGLSSADHRVFPECPASPSIWLCNLAVPVHSVRIQIPLQSKTWAPSPYRP
uniref:Uncharacterized protein n=1 Tax=Gorilla gorilla gorilla TaxID=9595 RepID=A0A2I2YXE4_GORGO